MYVNQALAVVAYIILVLYCGLADIRFDDREINPVLRAIFGPPILILIGCILFAPVWLLLLRQ